MALYKFVNMRFRPKINFRGNRGITLVEILISLLILAVLVTSLLYGFSLSHTMAKSLTYHSSAINLAQELMETVMADDYDNVIQNNYSGLADVTVSDAIVMSRAVAISNEYTYPGTSVSCKDVLITISWTESNRNLTETLFTHITNT